MVPFRGTFDHTLDAKNRLTMPARYRSDLAGALPASGAAEAPRRTASPS